MANNNPQQESGLIIMLQMFYKFPCGHMVVDAWEFALLRHISEVWFQSKLLTHVITEAIDGFYAQSIGHLQ